MLNKRTIMHSEDRVSYHSISPISTDSPENDSQKEREGSPAHCQGQNKQPSAPPTSSTRRMGRSFYILLPVIFYSLLVTFFWIITCILTHHPMTAFCYGVWVWPAPINWYNGGSGQHVHDQYAQNEKCYTAMRTIQAVATPLTLTLTSAVCSCAAVATFNTQRRDRSRHSRFVK